jgi:hypothetical protein
MPDPVPIACTLPAAQLPGRLAEFHDLYASAVRAVERVTPRHVRLRLAGAADLEATARDLLTRERQCCAFYDFALTPLGDGALTLDVRVPAGAEPVLALLARDAERAAGLAR